MRSLPSGMVPRYTDRGTFREGWTGGCLQGNLLEAIRAEIRRGNHRFTLHAGERMIERHVAVAEVEEAVLSESAEIIEAYPSDPRGPSCLILGKTAKGRLVHVQCSYPPHVAIITSYEPEPDEWLNGRVRRGERR